MKYEPKRVFVMDNGNYTEISYQEYCRRNEEDVLFRKRHFIPIQGMLLEVPETAYQEHYKETERDRYLKKQDKDHKLCSLEALKKEMGGNVNVEPVAADDVEQTALDNLFLEQLQKAVKQLTMEEQELFYSLYHNGLTERKAAKILKISQVAVHKRKHGILKKLKKLLEI